VFLDCIPNSFTYGWVVDGSLFLRRPGFFQQAIMPRSVNTLSCYHFYIAIFALQDGVLRSQPRTQRQKDKMLRIRPSFGGGVSLATETGPQAILFPA